MRYRQCGHWGCVPGLLGFMGAVIALFWPLAVFHGGVGYFLEALWLTLEALLWILVLGLCRAAAKPYPRPPGNS